MFEFVEKVVYINLEHRTDRREQVESELLKFFPAEKIVRFNATYHPKGYIGCADSHAKVLEMAIKNGWGNCLVLEDDAIWTDGVTEGHSLLEKLLKNKWDVITLSIAHATYTDEYRLMCGQTCTAYLVNKHYYPNLLNKFKESLHGMSNGGYPSVYAIDQRWKILQAVDNWYCVIPSIMVQKPSYSDIEKMETNYLDKFS